MILRLFLSLHLRRYSYRLINTSTLYNLGISGAKCLHCITLRFIKHHDVVYTNEDKFHWEIS